MNNYIFKNIYLYYQIFLYNYIVILLLYLYLRNILYTLKYKICIDYAFSKIKASQVYFFNIKVLYINSKKLNIHNIGYISNVNINTNIDKNKKAIYFEIKLYISQNLI